MKSLYVSQQQMLGPDQAQIQMRLWRETACYCFCEYLKVLEQSLCECQIADLCSK